MPSRTAQKFFKRACLGLQSIALNHANFFTKLATRISQNQIIYLPLSTSGTAKATQPTSRNTELKH